MDLTSRAVERSPQPFHGPLCVVLRPNGKSFWRNGKPFGQSTLRAAQAIALDPLTESAVDDHVTHDSYYGHGQGYGRLRWRA